jgi:hypothetical protein
MKIMHNAGVLALLCLRACARCNGPGCGRNPGHASRGQRVRSGGYAASETASQGVVTGKEIEEQPRSRVGEVLEVVAGLIATQHSGEGKANQYFLRGFNLDHGTDIDITFDDMPVNMRTHGPTRRLSTLER